jgi:hypothetical protein
MNYIKKLQEDNKTLVLQLADIEKDITNFMAYLQSDKFCISGDTIQANEVFIHMRELRMLTHTNP